MVQQISERTTGLGDKLEITFDTVAETLPFTVVFNDTAKFSCISWHEAEDLYDHFYSKVVAV